MQQTRGQCSKSSSVKDFSGERLACVLLYTNKIKERIIIRTNQLTSEKPRAEHERVDKRVRALLESCWISAQPFFPGEEIQLLLHEVLLLALSASHYGNTAASFPRWPCTYLYIAISLRMESLVSSLWRLWKYTRTDAKGILQCLTWQFWP